MDPGTLMLIGGAAGLGGAMMSKGKRGTSGYSAQQEEALRKGGRVWDRLYGDFDSDHPEFSLTPQEKGRALDAYKLSLAPTKEELMNQIQAESARAGLSGTNVIAANYAKMLPQFGIAEANRSVDLDNLSRELGIKRLGYRSNVAQILLGGIPENMVGGPTMRSRSPTFGQTMGQGLSAVGGLLAGAGAGRYVEAGWNG